MQWITANIPPALKNAIRAYRTASHVIALWDHAQCSGWQLYRMKSQAVNSTMTVWMSGAGADSVDWTPAQAKQWAEAVLANLPATSPDTASLPQSDAKDLEG
jgi:hypothetical protein